MLEQEREECLKEIQKYNKLMEPLNYVQEKELVGKKYEEIKNILNATGKDTFESEIIEADDRLAEKLEVMINVIGGLATDDPERLLTGKLTVFENASGQIMYLISNK